MKILLSVAMLSTADIWTVLKSHHELIPNLYYLINEIYKIFCLSFFLC